MVKSTIIPAAAYIRRSTDKQEASLGEQRKAITEYATRNGYTVVKWYEDDAISGDDTERRKGFQALHHDACNGGGFKVIVCWDQDRFGRFSPQEASYWTWPLSKAGVRLETVGKGPVDWSDFTEWLTYSVNQHGKHQFLRDLSRNVIRGQVESAKAGWWVGGVPYAYRLEGERKRRVLVVDDEGKADVVRRIYREYLTGRLWSEIADGLNADSIPSPAGATWGYWSVRSILQNPVYAGDYAFNRASIGKYHRYHDGRIVNRDRTRRATPNSEGDWITHRDHHPAIVDRVTWEKVQRRLEQQKGQGRPRHNTEANPFLLSGLLRCGRCGSSLWGEAHRGKRVYECGTAQYARKFSHAETCEGCFVHEERLLDHLATYVEREFVPAADVRADLWKRAERGQLTDRDLPEAVRKLRAIVAPTPTLKIDTAAAARKAGQLEAKIAKARGNLVLLDAEDIPAAKATIRTLEEELQRVQSQARPVNERAAEEAAAWLLWKLLFLVVVIRSGGDWRQRCASFKRLMGDVAFITVFTESRGTGRGKRYTFTRGDVHFHGVGVGKDDSNPHSTAPNIVFPFFGDAA